MFNRSLTVSASLLTLAAGQAAFAGQTTPAPLTPEIEVLASELVVELSGTPTVTRVTLPRLAGIDAQSLVKAIAQAASASTSEEDDEGYDDDDSSDDDDSYDDDDPSDDDDDSYDDDDPSDDDDDSYDDDDPSDDDDDSYDDDDPSDDDDDSYDDDDPSDDDDDDSYDDDDSSDDETGDDQPGMAPLAVGLLDAVAIAESENPGFGTFEAELEFNDGAFEWEVELVNTGGTETVEVDLSGLTGEVLESDTSDNEGEEAAKLAAASVGLGEALGIASAAISEGFVYEIEIENEDGLLVWEVGVLSEGRRFEVDVHAITGEIVEIEEEGDAHFEITATSGDVAVGFVAGSLTPGDTNDDGAVDGRDLLNVLAVFNTVTSRYDITYDGQVSTDDLLLVLASYGTVYND